VKLTIERDPEAIKRYGYLKPARAWGGQRCSARCPGTARTCTLEKGHRGPHVAHGMFKKVVAVWDPDTEVHASVGRLRTTLETTAGSGIRHGDEVGALEMLRGRLGRLTDSLGEIALAVFFLAMVGGFIYWLILFFRASTRGG
jgi:hypothetical protein